ncbi:hypothetical protein Hanom_Chr07g00654041 [Helianthus anomalus]
MTVKGEKSSVIAYSSYLDSNMIPTCDNVFEKGNCSRVPEVYRVCSISCDHQSQTFGEQIVNCSAGSSLTNTNKKIRLFS